MPHIIGYTRVSTQEQATSGLGLEAQCSAIHARAAERGWEIVAMEEDAGLSGKTMRNRPALARALTLLDQGVADTLVVYKLDRLSRSLVDFGTLLERAQANGWALVVLDMDLDMTTPSGRMIANSLMNFAQFEREMISLRVKDALSVKKGRGDALGRPRIILPALEARIHRDRCEQGMTLRAIAAGLEEDGVPTPGGGRWQISTIKSVLARVPMTIPNAVSAIRERQLDLE